MHVPGLMPLNDDSALFVQEVVVKFFPEAMSLSSMMIEETEMDQTLIAWNNSCQTWPIRRRIARRRKCSGQMYLELPALADTIKTLNDNDALELFKKTLPSNFVQIQVTADPMCARAPRSSCSRRSGPRRLPGRSSILLP